MLISACKSEGQVFTTGDKNIYIFEYPGKIYGQTIIGFFQTNDTFAEQIFFKITFTNEKIITVKKEIDNTKYKYLKKQDGNLYIDGLNLICFEEKIFKNKMINTINFYNLLSKDFLDISNKDRLNILEQLSK